jgi:hypothetical protein
MPDGSLMRTVKDNLVIPLGEVDRIEQATWWSPVLAERAVWEEGGEIAGMVSLLAEPPR